MIKLNEAYLELTRKCPLRCKHCYIGEKEQEFELPKNDWFKILEKLKKLRIKKIILLGGEPTTYQNFYDVLSYCSSSFNSVTVETSGVTDSYFSNYNCNVAVSFESCIPKENDLIRMYPAGNESVYKNAFQKLLKGRKYPNPRIIRMTLYNDTDVMGSIIMAERLGANLVLVPLMNQGEGTNLFYKVPDAGKIKEAAETCMISNLTVKGYHQVQIPQWYLINIDLFNKYSPLFKKQKRICSAGVQRIFIDYKGNAYPCMFIPQVKLGNFLKDKITKISKNLENFNKSIEQVPKCGKCKDCDAWRFCHGGCVAIYRTNKSRMGINCPLTINLNSHNN